MERGNDFRLTSSFQCKKWTLFTFCAIGIILTIIMASLVTKLMDSTVDLSVSGSSEYKNSVKEAALIWVWVISVLSILFHLVGLMGAYKEHYCMTVTYAVLITLSALGSIINATKSPYYWLVTVIYFVICGITYAFAYDLRRLRALQFSAPSMLVMGGGVPNTTIVNMGPGQYAPTGQAYVGPQYAAPYGYPSAGPAQANWIPPPYASPENKTID